jgi:hypothetical protein
LPAEDVRRIDRPAHIRPLDLRHPPSGPGRCRCGHCQICPLALRIRLIRLRLTAARSSRRTSTVGRRSP